MKRSSHRSSHAAVLGFKFGQRLQGSLVADHTRDLASAGDVGRLPLGGGLGLGLGCHSGGEQVAGSINLGSREQRAIVGRHVETEAAHDFCSVELGDVGRCGRRTEVRPADVVGAGGNGGSLGMGHFVLRVGPIPTMGISCHVTSDKSTTVGREAA